MTTRRHAHVVNLDELEPWAPPKPGPAPFGGFGKRIGHAAAGQALGANHFRVPAGRTAVPLHAHHNNEEAIFVLEGEGTLRIGDERVLVRAHDWIALPAGEACAHQLLADRGSELGYLVVSTMNPVDVVTYPDSGKLMAAAGPPPAGLRAMFRRADGAVDYWEGEGEPPA